MFDNKLQGCSVIGIDTIRTLLLSNSFQRISQSISKSARGQSIPSKKTSSTATSAIPSPIGKERTLTSLQKRSYWHEEPQKLNKKSLTQGTYRGIMLSRSSGSFCRQDCKDFSSCGFFVAHFRQLQFTRRRYLISGNRYR